MAIGPNVQENSVRIDRKRRKAGAVLDEVEREGKAEELSIKDAQSAIAITLDRTKSKTSNRHGNVDTNEDTGNQTKERLAPDSAYEFSGPKDVTSNEDRIRASPKVTTEDKSSSVKSKADKKSLGRPTSFSKGFKLPEGVRFSLRDSNASDGGQRRPRSDSWSYAGDARRRIFPFNFTQLKNNVSLPSIRPIPSLASIQFSQFYPPFASAKEPRASLKKSRPESPKTTSSVWTREAVTHSQARNIPRQQSPIQGRKGPDAISTTEAIKTLSGNAENVIPFNEPARPTKLMRSASVDSYLSRTFSHAPSLGDDNCFESVQGQINNRFKAIKDSLQDSSFKISAVPALPNLSLGPLRDLVPDLNSKAATGDTNDRTDLGNARSNGTATIPSSNLASQTEKSTYSHLQQSLDNLTGDIVVMGGYRGSTLRSAAPPHRQLWIPLAVGLNLRKVDLAVGLNREDEENMEERVIPGGMLTSIGPVDISRRLLKRLRGCTNARTGKLRVWEYGYDWRLSPSLLSRKLIEFLKELPANAEESHKKGAVVIAHSLGGLITRHAINRCPELFAGVLYAGVPTSCVNILGPLRNGDEVLLSSKVLTAQVNFSIRTSFALLPLDGKCFIDKNTREEYYTDFFDPQTWVEHALSPCVALPSPPSTNTVTTNGIVESVLSGIPGRKSSSLLRKSIAEEKVAGEEETDLARSKVKKRASDIKLEPENTGLAPKMTNTTAPTNITISQTEAMAYLSRVLAEVKKFKEETAFVPARSQQNRYPPAAVIYGKSTPTVCAAKVNGKAGIKCQDAYDDLAFASGDGVVLAKAAMLPEGYQPVKGGVVSSDRGHITLLGDLEAVGKCLQALVNGRRKGLGLGGG